MTRTAIRSMVDTAATLATLVAAVVLIVTALQNRGAGADSRAQVAPIRVIDGLAIAPGVDQIGDARARIAVVEFADYECPFCGKYNRDMFPTINKALIETGTITYSFRHFPLEGIHRAALKAGEAASCAGEQGRFWDMHHVLFKNQAKLDEPSLVDFARSVQVDERKFTVCLAEGHSIERIREDQEEAARFGIVSTPSFLVGLTQSNGEIKVLRKFSGASQEAFMTAVQQVLREAGNQLSVK